MSKVRVIVEDLDDAEKEREVVELEDDYVIICAGSCHVEHVNTFPASGTHVLTVKGAKPRQRL